MIEVEVEFQNFKVYQIQLISKSRKQHQRNEKIYEIMLLDHGKEKEKSGYFGLVLFPNSSLVLLAVP